MIPLLKKYEDFIPQVKMRFVNIRKKIRSKTVHAKPKACILSYLAFLCPSGKHLPEISPLPEIMVLMEELMQCHGLIEEVWNKLTS